MHMNMNMKNDGLQKRGLGWDTRTTNQEDWSMVVAVMAKRGVLNLF